jgi:hypothetical protein
MTGKLGERATGKGYKDEPLTPDENARVRHRAAILDDEFIGPDEFIRQVPPNDIASHIGLGGISALSLFIKKNKALAIGAVGLVGALNWTTVAEITALLGHIFK